MEPPRRCGVPPRTVAEPCVDIAGAYVVTVGIEFRLDSRAGVGIGTMAPLVGLALAALRALGRRAAFMFQPAFPRL